MLNNGKFFKARYMNPNETTYLGLDEYQPSLVRVRSSSVARCLMSAQSMLAGLFPTNKDDMESPLDVWQPIPVYMGDEDVDPLMRGYECPGQTRSLSKTISSNADFISFVTEYENVTTDVLNIFGYNRTDNNCTDVLRISEAYDTLFCEQNNNFTLKADFLATMRLIEPYYDFSWNLITMATDTHKSVRGGVLLRELKRTVAAAVASENDYKLLLYSGHDTTLNGVWACLGSPKNMDYSYGSTLVLEVWEEGDSHVIRLLLYSGDKISNLTLPGCNDTGCTPKQFAELNQHLELDTDEYWAICKGEVKDYVPEISKNTLFFAFCLVACIALLCILCLLICSRRLNKQNKRSDHNYKKQTRRLLDDEEF